MKVWEIMGIAVGCASIAGVAVRLLISQYFKKANELEELRRKNTSAAITRLDDEIKSVYGQIAGLSSKMDIHTSSMIKFQVQFDTLSERVTDIIDQADQLSKGVDERIKSQVRTQVIQLREDLLLLKKKRGGNGQS